VRLETLYADMAFSTLVPARAEGTLLIAHRAGSYTGKLHTRL
jgi:hypothetical protein